MSKSISLYEVKQGKKCNTETVAAHTSLQQPWWRWNTIQLKSVYITCNSPQLISLSTQHQCQLKPSKRGPFWGWVLLSSPYFCSPSPLQLQLLGLHADNEAMQTTKEGRGCCSVDNLKRDFIVMQTKVKDTSKYLFIRERAPCGSDCPASQVVLIFMTCLKFTLGSGGYLIMICSWQQPGCQVLKVWKKKH